MAWQQQAEARAAIAIEPSLEEKHEQRLRRIWEPRITPDETGMKVRSGDKNTRNIFPVTPESRRDSEARLAHAMRTDPALDAMMHKYMQAHAITRPLALADAIRADGELRYNLGKHRHAADTILFSNPPA